MDSSYPKSYAYVNSQNDSTGKSAKIRKKKSLRAKAKNDSTHISYEIIAQRRDKKNDTTCSFCQYDSTLADTKKLQHAHFL